MKKVDRFLQDYASSHRTKGNMITHFIGIPLIILGLMSMLVRLPLLSESFTAAEVLIILVTIFYFTLDVKLGAVMLIAVLLLDVMARGIGSFWIGFLIFATGWLFQGIGHAIYEKHSPAFFKNLIHLLIGPLFILNEVLHIRSVGSQTPTQSRIFINNE